MDTKDILTLQEFNTKFSKNGIIILRFSVDIGDTKGLSSIDIPCRNYEEYLENLKIFN